MVQQMIIRPAFSHYYYIWGISMALGQPLCAAVSLTDCWLACSVASISSVKLLHYVLLCYILIL